MKKILHVLSTTELSGAENVVADICMMFEYEYEMYYCSLKGDIEAALYDRGVKYIPVNNLSIKELKKVIKSYKPDVIHAHDVKATVISCFASGSVPVISHLHGNPNDMNKKTIKAYLYLLASFKVKKIIAVSNSCIDDFIFKKFIVQKSIVLRNIVYINRIKKLIAKDQQDYKFDFVFLGRLSYPKNPKRVAMVASKILKKLTNVRFGIIGDGEFKEQMVDIFKSEGILDRVIFTGKLSYPYKALKQARCMLMCSRYEGTPIAALEAMALGVPIVSTPVDGMKDLINNYETGYLSDDDNELAEFVINLISEESLNDRISKKSIEKFNEINNLNYYKTNLKNIYEEL